MNKYIIQATALQGTLLNPEPEVPEGAITFEGTEDYIFFEGQSAPDYITFETI